MGCGSSAIIEPRKIDTEERDEWAEFEARRNELNDANAGWRRIGGQKEWKNDFKMEIY